MLFTHKDKISSLILDSGTFTKRFSGATTSEKIDFEGFLAYCLTFKDRFDMIFNYDEEFDPHGYAVNMKYLDKLRMNGVNVVPVVHDYPGNEVDKYIADGFEMISLGWGKGGTKKQYYKSCVQKIKQAGKKVHLLGISSYEQLHDVQADTCDSSNYAQAARFGYVYYWDENIVGTNKQVEIRFADYSDEKLNELYLEDYEHREEFEEYIQNELQITTRDLYGHRKHFYRQLVNLDYYVKLQDRVREAHALNGWV